MPIVVVALSTLSLVVVVVVLLSCSPIWAVMQVIKINARFVRRRRCLSIFMLATLRMRNAWYV